MNGRPKYQSGQRPPQSPSGPWSWMPFMLIAMLPSIPNHAVYAGSPLSWSGSTLETHPPRK